MSLLGRKKGKKGVQTAFLTAECQLINVKVLMDLENHQWL